MAPAASLVLLQGAGENGPNGVGESMSVELISVLVAVLAIGATLPGADPDQQSRVAEGYARGYHRTGQGQLELPLPCPSEKENQCTKILRAEELHL